MQEPAVPGRGQILYPRLEMWSLWAYPINVMAMIQSARVPSTRGLYTLKWGVSKDWCGQRSLSPYQWLIAGIMSFLQELLEEGHLHSTVKVYLAAISACH